VILQSNEGNPTPRVRGIGGARGRIIGENATPENAWREIEALIP
jgi:hypothetical protein